MLRFLRILFGSLLGCVHTRTTFPITLSRRSPADGEVRRRTYVACLNCGEELAYNWHKMKIEGRLQDLSLPPTLVSISRLRLTAERNAKLGAVSCSREVFSNPR